VRPVVIQGCAVQCGFQHFFRSDRIFLIATAVEGHMTKKDKIAFIKSSKRKTHVYQDLTRYSDEQLNGVIREIVQGLIRESEIIANAYINGYR
jgi:predicted nucleic acid-binding OB-fold protein